MSDASNPVPPVEPPVSNEPPVTPVSDNVYPQSSQAPTNPLSVISLVGSIASFIFLPFIGAIVGIITGHIALNQIKRTGENGHSFALWGVILGYIHIALAAILAVIFVILFVVIGVNINNGIHNSVNGYSQCINQHPNSSTWMLHCETKFNKDFNNATN